MAPQLTMDELLRYTPRKKTMRMHNTNRVTTMKPLISITAVCYNESYLAKKFITNINKNCRYAHEIIIVDNASKDDSVKRFRKLGAKVVTLKKNIGMPAINYAIKKAKGNYIFFTGVDCLINSKTIENLINGFYSGVGLLSPTFYNENDTPQITGSWLNKTTWYAGSTSKEKRFSYTEIPFFGCGLITQETIKKIGGYIYKKNYFLYGEDVELGLRLQKKGLKTVIVKNAKVIHSGSQSAKTIMEKERLFYCERNMLRNCRDYAPEQMPIALLARIFRAGYNVFQMRFDKAAARIAAVWVVLNERTKNKT